MTAYAESVTCDNDSTGIGFLEFVYNYNRLLSLDGFGQTNASLSAVPQVAYGSGTVSLDCDSMGLGNLYVGSGITSGLAENAKHRSRNRMNTTWGTGTIYTRAFNCSETLLDTVIAADFAYGELMNSTWLPSGETLITGIHGPRVHSVTIRKQSNGAFRDVLVEFLQLDLRTDYRTGYNETRRTNPKRNGQFEYIVETWGVAVSENDANVPSEGDYLDGNTTNVRRPICVHVEKDKTALPGRVLVYAQWVQNLSWTFYRPDDSTSLVSGYTAAVTSS